MRKEYTKPELYAENFKIVEHIARACYTSDNQISFFKTYANHDDWGSCTFTDPGDDSILFANCSVSVDYNSYQLECYENAAEPMKAFAGS